MNISLPNNWAPRAYQGPLWKALQTHKRVVAKWHRRSGKDDVMLHHNACSAFERKGNYWYMLPEYSQCRKAIWDAINPHSGIKRIDEAFPHEIRKNTLNQEMKIEFLTGSTWQLMGSDNYDSLVGSPPIGLTYSEYALSNPSSWGFLRPILLENGGWAAFNSTPRGKNHFKKLCDLAEKKDDWFYSSLTVDDTGIFTQEQLLNELEELQSEHGDTYGMAIWLQEYYCLGPDTRVLMADLTWKTMSKVKEGDELIGVDEEADSTNRRKLRKSVITKRWETMKECFKLNFSDGTSIIASEEHPWLCKQKPNGHKVKRYKWAKTCDLEAGMYIADVGLRPWETDNSRSAGYLAGMYDGEGCVSRRGVQVAQNPGKVLDIVIDYLRDKGFVPYETNNKGTTTLGLSLHDTLTLLGKIRPVRMMQKAESIWNGVFPFWNKPALEIVKIDRIGENQVIGISTSTKTFIAEGLVTHNCSFEAAIPGAIWGAQTTKIVLEDRFGDFSHTKGIPVFTAWDIGRSDHTSIWFYQMVGGRIKIIDFHEDNFKEIDDYCDVLEEKADLGYDFALNWLPHDAKPLRLGMGGKTILQQFIDIAQKKSIGDFVITPKIGKEDGIQAARKTFALCDFDKKTEKGFEHLKSYKRAYDEVKKVFSLVPVHDEHSHASDAFIYLSLTWRQSKAAFPEMSDHEKLMAGNVVGINFGQMKREHFDRKRAERE